MQRRLLSGTFVLSAGAISEYYERGVITRHKIRQDFDRAFNVLGIDALLTPTTPTGPFAIKHDAESSAAVINDDPVSMYLNDVMTIPANLAGIPAISVPVALTENGEHPLGLQLMSARNNEEKMLNIAQTLEEYAKFRDTCVPDRVYVR